MVLASLPNRYRGDCTTLALQKIHCYSEDRIVTYVFPVLINTEFILVFVLVLVTKYYKMF